MQEEERIPHLLDKFDLSRFQLKDYRNFDECEYRVPGQTAKPAGKTYELVYNHTFNQDLLITHLDIEFNNREVFSQQFQMGQIQASKLTNRGMAGPVLRSKIPKSSRGERSLIVSCISITQSLKVSLLLRKEFSVLLNDVLSFKKQKSRVASQENVLKIIQYTIRAINICGYQLSTNTAASELVPLLNISQAFKHSSRFDEAAETDILVSLSLMSARRFVQAAESLRNASKFYLEKYISSKSSMDFTRIDKSWFKDDNRDQLEVSGFSKTFSSGRVLEGGRYLYKAAKIELLLADTINQPTLLGEKLEAFNRANEFANGNTAPSKIETRIDYQEVIYTIGGSIVPFLVKVLSDKSQIYKISALKAIQFFYETLGCTLGNLMPLILKTLISTYPFLKEESIIKTQQNLVQRFQTTSRTKLLLDHTNHLLESLLSLLQGMNKKYLKVIFEEIIQNCTAEEYRNELRLYLLRFGERIIQLCGSDLQIGVGYIKYVLAISEGKYSNKHDINKHINHNLVFFSQRIMDLFKNKILRQYNKLNCLNAIANWVNETLISLCESETVTSQPVLLHSLDLVIAIYANPKLSLPHPVQPIIYLLNTSLHEPKLPFEKILQAFIVLVKNSNRHDTSSELASEIIERVLGRSKMSTLGLKQLKILQQVLQTVKQGKKAWLQQFLSCIPHSNFDEIYAIFDLLISKTLSSLDKPLVSTIINTLFNQYTVKGKAHQQSKQLFLSNLLKYVQGSMQLLFEICLFLNPQPQLKNYYSKKAGEKDHGFDSKQFKLHSELFGQKINLLLLGLSKNQNVLDKLKDIFTGEMIKKMYENSGLILLQNHNFKIKSKVLTLIKHLTLLMGQLPDSQQGIRSKIYFSKCMLKTLRSFITLYKDSKLQYNAILNIGLILQKVTAIKHSPQDNDLKSLESMDKEETHLNIDFSLTFTIESFVGYELISMWASLMALLNSPLQCVREMLMLVLIHTFRGGFNNIHAQLRNALIEHFKPLLANSLQSNDHSERIMGVRLLALLIGLGKRYKESDEMLKSIERNLKPFKQFLQIIIVLEDDWNEDVGHCSKLISQLCISHQLRLTLLRKIKNGKKYTSFYDPANISFNLQDQMIFEKKQPSFEILNNFDAILKADEQFNPDESIELPDYNQEIEKSLTQFRLQIEKINFNALDNAGQKDSFVEEEQYYDPNQEKHSDKDKEGSNRSDEEQLEFQDLGIIDVDDEEWGEQENEVKITQKLPLKKVYKLSPNLGSSTKHRLRNKRMNPGEFEEDKIIIDEVEGRINSPPLQQMAVQQKIEQTSSPASSLTREPAQPEYEEEQRRNSLSEDLAVSEPKVKKEKKTVKKRKTSAK